MFEISWEFWHQAFVAQLFKATTFVHTSFQIPPGAPPIFLQQHSELGLTLGIIGPVGTVLFSPVVAHPTFFIAWGYPRVYEYPAYVLYCTIKITGIEI